jgi:hypothetical protein
LARESFVYDRTLGKLVNKEEWLARQSRGVKRSSLPAPQVMRDIEPFVNVAVDGKVIGSRSHKREMMKQHNLVEVGNERPTPRKVLKPKVSVRNSIKRSLSQLGV